MKQPSSLRVSTGFFVVLTIIALAVASVGAAPLNQATFPASEDVTLDSGVAGTNRNAFPLQLANSSGPGGETATRVVLLKFNVGANPLSGFSVAKARLNMATIGLPCGAAASNVIVNIYGTTVSDWSETTATWNSVAGVATSIRQATPLLKASDSVMPSTGHAYWTDASNGNLAQYVENARVNNGGVVSLWLEILVPSGISNVTMENRVLVGQTNNCAGGGLAPSLQIASADQPLAVTMSTFGATSDRSVANWPLYIGLGALAVLAAVGALLYRRRAAAR